MVTFTYLVIILARICIRLRLVYSNPDPKCRGTSEAFLHVALDNMRIHGGIGFTWEHDAHLFVRRAKTSELIVRQPRLTR